jgi:hypothetical protein
MCTTPTVPAEQSLYKGRHRETTVAARPLAAVKSAVSRLSALTRLFHEHDCIKVTGEALGVFASVYRSHP